MIMSSKISIDPSKKYFHLPLWLLLVLAISSCNLDENRRLHINQAFEGEEIFLNSKILDESLHLAFYDFETFQDTVFTDSLPGCPDVILADSIQQVKLSYGSVGCETGNKIERSGAVTIDFFKTDTNKTDSISMRFEDYQSSKITLNGTRNFVLTSKDPTREFYKENADSLIILDEHKSSSRLNLELMHEKQFTEQGMSGIVSTGTLTGRNWSGNEISMEITIPKTMTMTCLSQEVFRPVGGEESWTIRRTSGPTVTHKLVFVNSNNCETLTRIILSEGVVIEKRP